jgi:hypothetical protein
MGSHGATVAARTESDHRAEPRPFVSPPIFSHYPQSDRIQKYRGFALGLVPVSTQYLARLCLSADPERALALAELGFPPR